MLTNFKFIKNFLTENILILESLSYSRYDPYPGTGPSVWEPHEDFVRAVTLKEIKVKILDFV